MMTSRLLSQIFNQNSASIYETLRQNDAASSADSDIDDLEERAGMMSTGPVNFNNDPDDDESRFELQKRSPNPASSSSSFLTSPPRRSYFSAMSRSRGNRYAPARFRDEEAEEDNDEVPQSLLFEAGDLPTAPDRINGGGATKPARRLAAEPEIGGGSAAAAAAANRNRHLEEQWTAATVQTHDRREDHHNQEARRRARLGLIDPKERALWKWANVENLDSFLIDVYDYFLGKGIYSILLNRFLNLLTLAFVISFSTFMLMCIDYSEIRQKTKFSDVIISSCTSGMSGTQTFLLWILCFCWVMKAIHLIVDSRHLWDIHNFYTYLLKIPDSDMQTISWQDVVARLMDLRDSNPTTSNSVRRRDYSNESKQRMDAHDIANRLMRKENYLIALFNKDILDLTVPLPFLRNRGRMLTRTLEWNLNLCILDFVFNEQGQFRPLFLKDNHRRILSDALRKRFLIAGAVNLIFAPFIVTYFLIVFLLRNLNDFIKTPARIGHRQYTPLAEWKFREFNELYHLFQLRLNMSYPAAEAYIDQFPKEKTAQVARFVSFISGSLLGVLAIGALIDHDLINGFEITPGLNAVFYITILTTIVAVSRGMIPEDNLVYDPAWSISNVIEHTHYMPSEWKDKLHSDYVKREFMTLWDLKVTIFLQEVFSVIFTPFVLWFSLPKCSDKIIDFFREFTIHVDGIGYVCSFAVFNLSKPGQPNNDDLREEYFASKDNKMIASYLGFMDQYHGPQNNKGKRQHHIPYRNHAMSPQLTAEMGGPGGTKWTPNRRHSGMQQANSNHRESPTGKTITSPIPSTLLDSHHLPTRSMRAPMFHPSERDSLREEDESPTVHASKREEGRYRSNLGESFMSTRASSGTGAGVDEEPGKGAGVLDLLNQFVGAHGGENTGRTGVI